MYLYYVKIKLKYKTIFKIGVSDSVCSRLEKICANRFILDAELISALPYPDKHSARHAEKIIKRQFRHLRASVPFDSKLPKTEIFRVDIMSGGYTPLVVDYF